MNSQSPPSQMLLYPTFLPTNPGHAIRISQTHENVCFSSQNWRYPLFASLFSIPGIVLWVTISSVLNGPIPIEANLLLAAMSILPLLVATYWRYTYDEVSLFPSSNLANWCCRRGFINKRYTHELSDIGLLITRIITSNKLISQRYAMVIAGPQGSIIIAVGTTKDSLADQFSILPDIAQQLRIENDPGIILDAFPPMGTRRLR